MENIAAVMLKMLLQKRRNPQEEKGISDFIDDLDI